MVASFTLYQCVVYQKVFTYFILIEGAETGKKIERQ